MDQEIRPESRQDSDELDFDDSQEEFYIQSSNYLLRLIHSIFKIS